MNYVMLMMQKEQSILVNQHIQESIVNPQQKGNQKDHQSNKDL